MGPKRKASTFDTDPFSNAEVINFTGSEEYAVPPAKATRVNPPIPQAVNGISGQRFGESTTYLPLSQIISFEEDDAAAEDLMLGSQDYDASMHFIHYGALDTPRPFGLYLLYVCTSADISCFFIDDVPTKIVGVRYYRGYASIGERVILTRQPRNQFDPNAIQVSNVMGHQIGHIPRQVAAKLAKYMVCWHYGMTLQTRDLILSFLLT